MIKLNLGCGTKPLPGFINVDIDPKVSPDVVDDVTALQNFEDNSVDLIYACHLLEHFPAKDTHCILMKWGSKLKSGGTLRLAVPDLKAIMQLYIYYENVSIIHNMLMGSQKNEWQFHKAVFDEKSLYDQLLNAGFDDIEHWSWQLINPHKYCDDYSQAYYPDYCKQISLSNGKWIDLGGKLISLNLQAKKI